MSAASQQHPQMMELGKMEPASTGLQHPVGTSQSWTCLLTGFYALTLVNNSVFLNSFSTQMKFV